ncbi:MAG: hypothetical protein ACTS27_08360 [Phycisphaerales bacterium]
MRPRPVTVLAGLVCLAGVAVGVRALLPEREPPKPVYTPEGLTAYDDMSFDRRDDASRLTDDAIDAFLRNGFSMIVTTGALTDEHVAFLVERTRSRLRMIVGPDGPTLEEVRVADGSPPEGQNGNPPASYLTWADHWRGAPISLEQSVVRVIPGEDGDSGNFRLGSSGRSPLRGTYPAWSRDDEIIEVVFAARPTTPESAKRVGVYLAFAYARDPDTGRWRFVDNVVYYPEGRVIPPAY